MTGELRAFVALVVIAVLGWVGYQMLFKAGEAPHVVLQDVHGSVDIESGGRRQQATDGAQIGAADRLVAGADGEAVLAFGEENRVKLGANTSVQVTSVDATGVRLSLENGRVQATIRPGGPGLGITAGDKSVDATDADFTVARTADGVGVESTRGAVTVDGASLQAGQRTVIPKDGTPLQLPTSEALLLQMAWPGQTRTSASKVRLQGSTEPGAHVRARTAAGTAETRAGRDGAFTVEVELGEGENAVAVDAVNVFGQVARADWHVARDSTPPAIGVRIE